MGDRAEHYSSLKHMRISPRHFIWHREHLAPATDAMLLGRLTHTAVLQPDRVLLEYAVWPGGRRDGKKWDAFLAASEEQGLTVVREQDWTKACAIRDAVRSHPDALALIQAATHIEHKLEWNGVQGQPMHGRPDIIGADYVADLKTTQSLSPGLFSSTAWRLGYFFQAGIYLEAANELFGMRERSFYWIAVESNPPHDVAVFEADVESVNRGWEEYRSCVSLLAECEATGQWPGQFPERVRISAPGWAGASEDDVDFSDVEGSEE